MPDPTLRPDALEPAPSWAHEGGGGGDATIEENWLFRLRRERFRSRRSGRVHDFYVMHLADAVNVIAITPDDQVVLVRQFRAGSGRDSLEPPGGLLDPGEDPCAAGARELREETGYAGDPAVLLGSAWSNPSILSSRISVVVVTNARRMTEPEPDVGEEVALECVPARSVPRLIREGKIDHALSVMGLLWWLGAKSAGPAARNRLSILYPAANAAVLGFGLFIFINKNISMFAAVVAAAAVGLVFAPLVERLREAVAGLTGREGTSREWSSTIRKR